MSILGITKKNSVKRYTKSRIQEKLGKALKLAAKLGALAGMLLIILPIHMVIKACNDVASIQSIEIEAEDIPKESSEINNDTTTKPEIAHTDVEEHTSMSGTISESTTISQADSQTSNLIYIRCTAYCDTGFTASGAYTVDGCVAGRKEWLGRKCRLYRVNGDGTTGECLGTFEFKDTGFGLNELNGITYPNGTIMSGASIDMWHPTEEACWDWVAEYGDYVYMEFIQ